MSKRFGEPSKKDRRFAHSVQVHQESSFWSWIKDHCFWWRILYPAMDIINSILSFPIESHRAIPGERNPNPMDWNGEWDFLLLLKKMFFQFKPMREGGEIGRWLNNWSSMGLSNPGPEPTQQSPLAFITSWDPLKGSILGGQACCTRAIESSAVL